MKKIPITFQILKIFIATCVVALTFPFIKGQNYVLAQTVYPYTVSYQGSGAIDQDDMAVWVHPTNPSSSIMVGSDKFANIVFTYTMSGQQIQKFTDVGQPGNIDIRYNFRLNGQNTDIVAFNDRRDSIIRVFKFNTDGTLTRVDNGQIRTLSPNYGFGLYKSPVSGKLYGFVTTEGGSGIEQIELYDDGTGKVAGSRVRNWSTGGGQSEGVVVDDEKKLVYIAHETSGIWRVGAEPTDPTPGTQPPSMKVGQNGIAADIEGLALYRTGNGGGYLIASSQGNSQFKIFDRNSYAYLKTIKVSGASSTDGIEAINSNLGPSFPQGIFLAHSGGSAIRGVKWDTIAQAEGLTIDTSWNPRGGITPTTTSSATPTNRINTITVTPSISAPLGKHLHLFIDGEDKGPQYSKSPIQVSNLTPGPHTITLKLANPDHSFTGIEDTTNVTVTGNETITVTPTRTGTPTPTTTRTGTPSPTPSGPITNPLTDCSKYPEKRLFLETQAWWMATSSIGTSEQIPVNGNGGHAHTATCFPQDQQIAGGTLRFDVRLMLHKGNRGRVEWLDIGLGPDGQSLARVNLPNLTCAGASDPKVQCEWWIPIELDTSKVPSGYQELRFRFNVIQPNGERQFASTGWQAWYRGGTSTYRTPPYVEARGWYTGANYENSRVTTALPYTPVSGIFTFKASMAPGSGGIATATHAVHVDARFNFDDFGKIYSEGTGSFSGTVSIDTTQLTNGPHCVALRTSSVDKNGGTDTGILQFPIVVNNPGRPSGNGKGGCQPGT